MYSTTVSTKFQLSVPKGIREEMSIKAGQKMIFIPKGNVIMLVPQNSLADIKGVMKGANKENFRDRSDRV